MAQQYEIEVVTQGNLPLTYTLKDGENNLIGQFKEDSTNTSKTFQNENMKFQAGHSEEHSYNLQIQWPDKEKDSGLAGIPDTVKININVKQID